MGFRYHTAWRKDRVVSLIATDETLQYVYDDAVTLGEQPYGIARGTRRLMPLTERLHPAALWHCVEECTSGHPRTWLRGREVFDGIRALIHKDVELATARDRCAPQ